MCLLGGDRLPTGKYVTRWPFVDVGYASTAL